MVERCADCGFDLAGGKVEVVPTAHYMMGGVQFNVDCTTEMPRLYAAGEDTGGVHGANRLGGNGVANSTVFGGLAGDSMAATLRANAKLADPDKAAIEAAHERAYAPLGRRRGDLESVRRRLYQVMWDDVGILRTADGLDPRPPRAEQSRHQRFPLMGVADPEKRYNLTWMDRLNLENLVLTSRAICAAAQARTDSRGAHYREDFPETSDLAAVALHRRPRGRTTASRSRPSRSSSPAFAPANRCCRRRRNEAAASCPGSSLAQALARLGHVRQRCAKSRLPR